MTSAAKSSRVYRIEITTCFDRPERRGAGFRHTPEAHSTGSIRYSGTCAAMVAEFNSILSGSWDFGCEYACRVQVWSTNADGSCPRTVRVAVHRARIEGTDRAETVATESECFARRMAAKHAQLAA